MDLDRFDGIKRTIGSRRTALSAVVGGAAFLGLSEVSAAKKKRKKKCKVKSGTCLCASGEMCLANGSCGQFCNAPNPCPDGCTCGSTGIDATVCEQTVFDCESVPFCDNTASCPRGSVCRAVLCNGSPGAKCVPLCAV